jgi:hypothetical protein
MLNRALICHGALVILLGCSDRRPSVPDEQRARVRTPALTPIAWLDGADTGIVYFRTDVIGVGLGDAQEQTYDSGGLYVTRGGTPGRLWRSSPALFDVFEHAKEVSLSMRTPSDRCRFLRPSRNCDVFVRPLI